MRRKQTLRQTFSHCFDIEKLVFYQIQVLMFFLPSLLAWIIQDEIGPYAFYRHRRKLDVQFSPDNSTVSFNEFEYLTPCPEHSNGTLDDDITTLNIPLVGAIEAIQARASSMIAPWLLLLARLVEGWGDPRVAGLFTTRTAEELLFGYEDSLLCRASRILPGAGINPTFALVRNMSSEGESSKPPERNAMATGSTHLSDVCQFRTWHGVQQVRAWQPPHVEEVRGTDATQFRPGLGRGSSVEVWVGEAFRAMKLIQVMVVVMAEQIPLHLQEKALFDLGIFLF